MKAERTLVSKKIRFEVFKRDEFKCAYCGNSPPKVILEIDHIEPVAKGGTNDINNLITACFNCNRGKSKERLNKIPPKLFDNLEILKTQQEQIKEYRRYINLIKKRELKDIKQITDTFEEYFPKSTVTNLFINASLKRFLRKLPLHKIIEAMHISCSKIYNEDRALKYFCGICWHKIRTGGT